MKGIVFKEFVDLVESKFGDEVVDQVFQRSQLSSGGAYTSVGTYDHSEMIEIIGHLSEIMAIPAKDLVKTFGSHLIGVFKKNHPEFFKKSDVFEFLKSVDGLIHVQVRKLYPDAELPKFTCEQKTDNQLVMTYSSTRPFADLAEGLIEGVIEDFDGDFKLESVDLSEGKGTEREFILTRGE